MPDLVAHLAPTGSAPGTEAACGYRLTGRTPQGSEAICPRCDELTSAPQSGALLVHVREHSHVWQRAGTLSRNGWWFTLWECSCGEQVIDINQRNTVWDRKRRARRKR